VSIAGIALFECLPPSNCITGIGGYGYGVYKHLNTELVDMDLEEILSGVAKKGFSKVIILKINNDCIVREEIDCLNNSLDVDTRIYKLQQENPVSAKSNKALNSVQPENSTEETQNNIVFQHPQLVLIPGGTFLMGNNEHPFDDAQPVHKVMLKSFYAGKYEVSNNEYVSFLNSQGNQIEGGGKWIDLSSEYYTSSCGLIRGPETGTFKVKKGYEDRPITFVSWYGAVAYCNWISEQEGLKKFYGDKDNREKVIITANGYRLLTEAEWEYAYRGGTNTEYYWGDTMYNDYCWYSSNSGFNYHDRGTMRANNYGLYDMSGNVYEWCNDWFHIYPAEEVINPAGPFSGSLKVLRGGCWISNPYCCRGTYRSNAPPYYCCYITGFRIAINK